VEAVNDALEEKPEIINEDPCGEGWICKLTGCSDADRTALMSAREYEEYVKGLE
jgi:glycine cleavage system H protein